MNPLLFMNASTPLFKVLLFENIMILYLQMAINRLLDIKQPVVSKFIS